MNTIAFRRGSAPGRPYLVLVHTAEAPRHDEWNEYLRLVGSTLAEVKMPLHIFIATDGGGPDATQRKDLATLVKSGSREGFSHIFTTSGLVRGIVTAFRWIVGAHATAHHPSEFALVTSREGYEPSHVLGDLLALQALLAPLATVHLIEQSSAPKPALFEGLR